MTLDSKEPPRAGVAPRPASAIWESGGEETTRRMAIGGDWQMGGLVPKWENLIKGVAPQEVVVLAAHLGNWDTSLLLFIIHAQTWCCKARISFRMELLPPRLSARLTQFSAIESAFPARPPKRASIWARYVSVTEAWTGRSRENIAFLGGFTLAFLNLLRFPRHFRWLDFVIELQQSWVSSLPIVALVSFLIGVVLAFQASIQLQQFGAAIFVADLVGLSVVREMGPMMAAVIVAGGTGAGFAARLGNMRVDQAVDAIETLGLSSVNFLALPRVLAVTLMMPVLAMYANILGILGGMLVSGTMLKIPPAAYWLEIKNRVGLTDVTTGLAKSLFFGAIVGLTGCLRGLHCDRSAAGVGTATSSAVVTSISLVVVADAVFALIFNELGI